MYDFYGPRIKQCPSRVVETTNGTLVNKDNTAKLVERDAPKTGENPDYL